MNLEIKDFQMNYLENRFFKLKGYKQIFHINMHAKYDPENLGLEGKVLGM